MAAPAKTAPRAPAPAASGPRLRATLPDALPRVATDRANATAEVTTQRAAKERATSERATFEGAAAQRAVKAPVLLAQLTQGTANTPAAAPQEQPRGLEVPVGPDQGNPIGAAAAPPPDAPTPGANITPNAGAPDVSPDVPPVIGNVTEAEGREISDVRVVGNRVIPAETILAQVRTQRGAAFSARQAELDRGRIDQLGFFATVQSQVAPDVNDPNRIVVTFIVQENRVVTGFKFLNSSALQETDLVPVLTSKIGVVLNRNNVNQDVTAIQKLYTDRGYAVLVQNAALDESGTLVFTIQEARVSRIEISGLKRTRQSLIRRQIRVKNGDVFDAAKLRRDLNRIYDLSFFDDATFKVDDDPALPGSVIVTYLLKEKRTGQLSFGVGFDSRSKLSVFGTVSQNNIGGTGKRALASVETGSRRNYEVSYGNPFVGNKNSSYDVSAYRRTLYREPSLLKNLGVDTSSTYSYEERRDGGRLNFTAPLDYDRTRTLLFGYRNERARLFQTDNSGNVTPVTNAGNTLNSSGTVSALSFGFLRDKRDLRLDPSRGSREQIILEQGFKLLGDTKFTKLDLDLRRYIPLIRGAKAADQAKLIFAGRAVIGKSLNQLPAFEQYYIGGADTVRGYDTDVQFGDNQFYSNLELRYRFQNKIQVVGFVDAGSAFGGNFSSDSSLNTLFAYGAGVRLQTPIGPVRLDVGIGRDGAKTQFGIGPTF